MKFLFMSSILLTRFLNVFLKDTEGILKIPFKSTLLFLLNNNDAKKRIQVFHF